MTTNEPSQDQTAPGASPPVIKLITQEKYRKTASTAIRFSIAKRTTDWEQPALVSMTQVVQDLIERDDLQRSTKTTLRASLTWYIETGDAPQSEDSRRALSMLKAMIMPRGPKPKITRPRSITEEDLGKLVDEIYTRADRSIWAQRTAVWIFASLATGTRPIEWLDAEWTDPAETSLRIKNAKIKRMAPAFLRRKESEGDHDPELENLNYWETDPTKEYRTVPLAKESDRSMVATQLSYISENIPSNLPDHERRESFQKYFDACRLVLNRACRKIWGGKRLYSLYTFRKQFSANMKAVVGAEETAALMGHASADSPSAAHYGKANQAHSRFKTSKGPQSEGLTQVQAPSSEIPSEGPSHDIE